MKFTICNIQVDIYDEPIRYDVMAHFREVIDERLLSIQNKVLSCNCEKKQKAKRCEVLDTSV